METNYTRKRQWQNKIESKHHKDFILPFLFLLYSKLIQMMWLYCPIETCWKNLICHSKKLLLSTSYFDHVFPLNIESNTSFLESEIHLLA